MSSGTRPSSTYPEKRSSSTTNLNAHAADRASSRPRISHDAPSARADRESRRQPYSQSSMPGYASTSSAAASAAHNRSTSANSRPTTRTTVDEHERRTDKVQVTTRETIITRTRSPDRRSAPADKNRAPEPRQRQAEPRPRESRSEAPLQGTHHMPCATAETAQLSPIIPYSTVATRGYSTTTYDSTPCLSYIYTPSSILRPCGSSAETVA